MKTLLVLLSLFCSLNVFAAEDTQDSLQAFVVKEGKLVIDLKKVNIEDILLRDGTVIDAQILKKLFEGKNELSRGGIHKASSGSDGGGG